MRRTNKSPARKRSPSPKNKPIDTTFILKDLNLTQLDSQYILPELEKRQHTNNKKPKDNDMKKLTTSLSKLGIAPIVKQPHELILWGEQYKIKLWLGNQLLTPSAKLKCSWCHEYPRDKTLMTGVPYAYIPPQIEQYVYASESINVVDQISVEPGKEDIKKVDQRNETKVHYFRRSLLSTEIADRQKTNKPSYKIAFVCCSLNCAESKALELSKDDVLFRESRMLIRQMYFHWFGKEINVIEPAPHFTLLENYGGPLTIEEFRGQSVTLSPEASYRMWSNYGINISNKLFVLSENV